LVEAAGTGDAVSDFELKDAVEVDEGEVEFGFGLEEGGGGGLGVEGHIVLAFLILAETSMERARTQGEFVSQGYQSGYLKDGCAVD
jgi:hypothetical protein